MKRTHLILAIGFVVFSILLSGCSHPVNVTIPASALINGSIYQVEVTNVLEFDVPGEPLHFKCVPLPEGVRLALGLPNGTLGAFDPITQTWYIYQPIN